MDGEGERGGDGVEGEKRKMQDGYVHLSLNIGITRMPLCRRFVPRRLHVYGDIRAIVRNTTFFTGFRWVLLPFIADTERWNGQPLNDVR